jgi:hypothetical protein
MRRGSARVSNLPDNAWPIGGHPVHFRQQSDQSGSPNVRKNHFYSAIDTIDVSASALRTSGLSRWSKAAGGLVPEWDALFIDCHSGSSIHVYRYGIAPKIYLPNGHLGQARRTLPASSPDPVLLYERTPELADQPPGQRTPVWRLVFWDRSSYRLIKGISLFL